MKTYTVQIPIAGHLSYIVEAENEEEAIKQAFEKDYSKGDDLTWEKLDMFNRGNVCYCPSPWEVTATEE